MSETEIPGELEMVFPAHIFYLKISFGKHIFCTQRFFEYCGGAIVDTVPLDRIIFMLI